MNIEQTKQYIEKYHLSLSKSLGQNFLINEDKLQEIVIESEITKEDLIIEVGPGIGTLSTYMAPLCGKLILIEIDSQLIPVLNDVFDESKNVEILHGDALVVDYKKLCEENINENPSLKKIKVIANLPYYITTPIITKLLMEIPDCERMVFTIQKEAADRIMSPVRKKEYGILSVLAQFYAIPSIADLILPNCFLPQPTVISCILVMKRREGLPEKRESLSHFLRIVQASFNQRRKTLMNSLGGSGFVPGGKAGLEVILNTENISLKCRAEELTYLQFLAISEKIIVMQQS